MANRAESWFSASLLRRWYGFQVGGLIGLSLVACAEEDEQANPQKFGGTAAETTTESEPESSGEEEEPTDESMSQEADSGTGSATEDSGDDGGLEPRPESVFSRTVLVTLDGEPSADVRVMQGGRERVWRTDVEGKVVVDIDPTVKGDMAVLASHPDARIEAAAIYGEAEDDEDIIELKLLRFDRSDNEAYEFQDHGTPERWQTTNQCAHCHRTINEDWFGSPHRSSASNSVVQDLYAGVHSKLTDESSCVDAGGKWWTGLEPGTRESKARCYLGEGVLPSLNDCGVDEPCDEVATAFGQCADCHAPAINGKLGGRDLLEATSFAYEGGVHCDLCHKVESVDLEAEPGVAGRLHVVRPSEMGGVTESFVSLTFAPYHDVAHKRMGPVQRDHFFKAEFCAGCHQQDQAVLVPDETIDSGRWPEGRLPIHSTYEEWEAGPLNPSAPCSSCHMPPDPEVWNSADAQLFGEFVLGLVGGWLRPAGAVRAHKWVGPRAVDSQMLQLAAQIFIDEKSVTEGTLHTEVRVKNVGPGHALPTGEPMRSMVLNVSAWCGETRQPATGGDAIPDFSGALASKESPEDWTTWPQAQVGQVLRVVEREESWYDYSGFGPFGDGRFTPEQKGMPVEKVVGEATITAVDGEGKVTLDEVLPAGDRVYLGEPDPFSDEDSETPQATALAGGAGFAFARVLVDGEGNKMVPHYRAVDVISDNRLLPQESWTTQHEFAVDCEDPTVRARLDYRPYPIELARERRWDNLQTLMIEVTK